MTRATLFRAQIYPLDYNSGEMASLLGRPGADVILRILLFLLLQLFSVLAGVSIHLQLSELDGDQYGALNFAELKLQTCSCELSDNFHKKSSPFERFRELSRFPRGLEDSGATICPGQWYICSRQWFICWFSPNWATNQDVQRRAAAQFLTICWHADGLRVA